MEVQLAKRNLPQPEPILIKIDFTRDLLGTFFIVDNLKVKVATLQAILE